MKSSLNYSFPEVCAKAVTAAGNLRSATNAYCGYGAYDHTTYIDGATPNSLAYGYYGGCQCFNVITGRAGT